MAEYTPDPERSHQFYLSTLPDDARARLAEPRDEVAAFDEAGSIGEGEHLRAVVDTERLLQGAERRRPQTG